MSYGRKINPGGFPVTGPSGAPGTPGPQGVQGPPGAQGPAGTNGTNGVDGTDGVDGRGIVSIVRTAGTGAPGTTDTYTITYTDATTSTFFVYNGANGTGTGDVTGPASAVNNNIVVFDATTGKLVKDGGTTIAAITGAIAAKQDTLVSGTNIKTVNGNSLLGSGNVTIATGSGDVVGPASATADALAIYNGTTGKLIKSSPVTVDANGVLNLKGILEGNLTANSGTSYTPNLNDATLIFLTMTGDCTLNLGTPTKGKSVQLVVKQSLSTAFLLALPAAARGINASNTYALTTVLGNTDVISFVGDGTYWLFTVAPNFDT